MSVVPSASEQASVTTRASLDSPLAYVLPALSFCLMVGVGLRFSWKRLLTLVLFAPRSTIDQHSAIPASLTLYNRVVISLDYLHFGFVRRGLGGTIAALSSNDFIAGAYLFHCLSLIALAIPIAVLIHIVAKRQGLLIASYFASIIVLSPQTFLAWAPDVGRTDMLSAAFIVVASLMTELRHRRSAIVILCTGYLCHETTIIYGMPLLAVQNWLAYRDGEVVKREAVALVTGAVGLLSILVAFQVALTPSIDSVKAAMMVATPPLIEPPAASLRDIAIFMATSGLRGLHDAACYNFKYNHQFGFMVAAVVLIILAYCYILQIKSYIAAVALAIVAPTLFMLLVAMDLGRWTEFAILNAWLLALCLRGRESSRAISPQNLIPSGCAFVIIFFLGPSSVGSVNAFAQHAATQMGLPVPGSYEDWLDYCDPTWRSFVHHGGP